MSKKVIKKKTAKPAKKAGGKALKPSKSKPSKPAAKAAKGKPAKAVKSSTKKVAKPVKPVKKAAGKAVAKKVIKKVVAKKSVKKAVKAVKKISPKKAVKKVVKPAKPSPKAKVLKKVSKPLPVKVKKVEKPVKKAPAKVEKPVKKAKEIEKVKAVKPVPVKIESPKPPKAEKVRKSKKGKKNKDDEEEPVIGNDPLIEEIIKATSPKRKSGPKQPKIIKTFVNPMAALAVAPAVETGKKTAPKKEPKGKYELEYVVRTSAGILYEFLTTPSGLSEWFADDVNIRDGIFTFFWDGSEQKARLLNFKEDKHVRMQWVDKVEGSYFEFKIERDELTGDVSLIITDFADEGSDLDTSKRLWDSQVNKLLHVIGSY